MSLLVVTSVRCTLQTVTFQILQQASSTQAMQNFALIYFKSLYKLHPFIFLDIAKPDQVVSIKNKLAAVAKHVLCFLA